MNLGFGGTNLVVTTIDVLLVIFAANSPSVAESCKIGVLMFRVARLLIGAGWLVAGSIFVYSMDPKIPGARRDESAPDHCDYNTYWFAFTVTTLGNIGYGIFLFCGLPSYFYWTYHKGDNSTDLNKSKEMP